MKKPARDVPLIYIFLYQKAKKNLVGTPFVRPSYLLEILKRTCRIPHVLNYPILKDMETWELIKRINKQSYEVLNHSCTNKLKQYHFKSDRSPFD